MYTTKTAARRPVWKNHKIIGYVIMSRDDVDFLNKIQNKIYLGFTKEEKEFAKKISRKME